MNRRDLLKRAVAGAGLSAVAGSFRLWAAEPRAEPSLCFGVVTDVHYADIPSRGVRDYRRSLEKLKQAVATFRKHSPAFIIELGDLIDADPEKRDDLKYLETARAVLKGFSGPCHYVLGNHCVWVLGKERFMAGGGLERSYYSFDSGPCHCVVLDACFSKDEQPYQPGRFDWKDSWIPAEEQRWLADDLARAKDRRTLIFVHQNLHDETRNCGIKNAPDVRKILERAGNVLAVFQGHEHTGGYAHLGGIHYITLRGMVEGSDLGSNAYAMVTVEGRDRLRVEGFGKQPQLLLH